MKQQQQQQHQQQHHLLSKISSPTSPHRELNQQQYLSMNKCYGNFVRYIRFINICIIYNLCF